MYIGSNRAAIMSFKTGDRVFGSGVLFVFASSYLRGDSCLIYVICVCLRIVVSNTYSVVFLVLFCLSSSCVLCTQCLNVGHTC